MRESDQNQLAVTSPRYAWRAWSETIKPDPSLANLYRIFEWMSCHDASTNYRVLGLFATLLIVLYCLVASFKIASRASTRWHVSPLAVALILLHLSGEIELGTLAEITSDTTFWISIKSAIHLIDPRHGLRRYRGPAAYTLICLAVWETLVFVLSPLILSQTHPRERNSAEWSFYTVVMVLMSLSVDTEIVLPLINRSGQFMSIRETYGTMETFFKTVLALTAVLLIFTGVFALVLDALLFEGCMIDRMVESYSIALASAPLPERISADATDEAVSASLKAVETSTSPDADIAMEVENFLWTQMCAIKQQAQALEALAISAETDDLSTAYSKLGRSYAAIMSLRPLLDGLIAIRLHMHQPVDHLRQQLSATEKALEETKIQLHHIVYEHNDINFIRVAPDPDLDARIAMLKQDAEGFIHVHLDRQQIVEDLMEAEDDLEMLENKVGDNVDSPSSDFSTQIRTQTANLRRYITRILEERAARTIPTPEKTPEQPLATVTPVEGLQLLTCPPGETKTDVEKPILFSAGRRNEAPSLLFSTSGSYHQNRIWRRFETDPPIIDLTGESPRSSSQPSPRKEPSTPARTSPVITDENAEPTKIGKPPMPSMKKSADHMVVGLWVSATTLEFRSDKFLRGHGGEDLLKPDDLLAIGELGRYLTSKVRGNRAETAAASKILINLEKCARASKENGTTLNVGVNNLNYFRSCMWLGQARLTKFPPPTQDRVFTEIPIEGIIKLAGYGPDGIKSLNMLPVPNEIWAAYLRRLAASTDIKKIKELHEWLERYLGGLPKLLNREVPRAEGWNTGVPLDANRCLYRHLENMMLLPPYPAEIEKALSIHRMEKTDDPNFVGSALVENLLDSPKSNNMASILRFQAL